MFLLLYLILLYFTIHISQTKSLLQVIYGQGKGRRKLVDEKLQIPPNKEISFLTVNLFKERWVYFVNTNLRPFDFMLIVCHKSLFTGEK